MNSNAKNRGLNSLMKGGTQTVINKVQMEWELVYMKFEDSNTNLVMVVKTFQQHFLLSKNH